MKMQSFARSAVKEYKYDIYKFGNIAFPDFIFWQD